MRTGGGAPVLRIGDRASFSRTIGEREIQAFAVLTGDRNPIHLDAEFAGRTRFGRPVAHGMLSASLISAVLGMRLPGPGAIYMSQTLRFLRPVFPGDTVTATVEVTAYRAERGIVTLRTTCADERGRLLLDGEAVLLVEPAP